MKYTVKRTGVMSANGRKD